MILRVGILVAVALLLSCNRKDKKPKNQAPYPGVHQAGDTFESYVPAGAVPYALINLEVAFTENVTLPAMQSMFAAFVSMNQSLWNVTEGQIRIARVRIRDNAHPGLMSANYDTVDTSGEDILVFPPANFNGPGAAFVSMPDGRNGRLMGVPTTVSNNVFVHEMSHFAFDLSWAVAPILVDEYSTAPQDTACVMELTYSPLRWCHTDNHLSQTSQPTSCWEQILADYPAFSYVGANVAGDAAPDPVVEYTDNP